MPKQMDARTVWRNYMKPLVESGITGVTAAGALLHFLAYLEAHKQELKLDVVFDDQVSIFVHLLKNIPHTDYMSKEKFARIVGRHIAPINGNAELFEDFVMSLTDHAIAEAARLYGEADISWNEEHKENLAKLIREAIPYAEHRIYAPAAPSPAIAQILIELAQELGENRGICVPYVGFGELIHLAHNAGMNAVGFAHDAANAALASMLIALEGTDFELGDVRVRGYRQSDDIPDYGAVIVIQDYWSTNHALDATYDELGNRIFTNEPDDDRATSTLLGGLRYASSRDAVVIGLTDNGMSFGARTLASRIKLMERGLDTVCEFSQYGGQQLISVIKPARDKQEPLLLAAITGEEARKAGLDVTAHDRENLFREAHEKLSSEAEIAALVRLLVDRQELRFISRRVTLEEIQGSKDASVRYSSYAESVNVAQALSQEASLDELLHAADASREQVQKAEELFSDAIKNFYELIESEH